MIKAIDQAGTAEGATLISRLQSACLEQVSQIPLPVWKFVQYIVQHPHIHEPYMASLRLFAKDLLLEQSVTELVPLAVLESLEKLYNLCAGVMCDMTEFHAHLDACVSQFETLFCETLRSVLLDVKTHPALMCDPVFNVLGYVVDRVKEVSCLFFRQPFFFFSFFFFVCVSHFHSKVGVLLRKPGPPHGMCDEKTYGPGLSAPTEIEGTCNPMDERAVFAVVKSGNKFRQERTSYGPNLCSSKGPGQKDFECWEHNPPGDPCTKKSPQSSTESRIFIVYCGRSHRVIG